MSSNPYPAIPEVGQSMSTLVASVIAMRQAVQLLVTAALVPTAKLQNIPNFTQSTSAPISPNIQDLWYNPTTAKLSIWINVGTGNAWYVI